MTWKKNMRLFEDIQRNGETYGLPLFSQPKEDLKACPSWIFSGADIKGAVFQKLQQSFSRRRLEVLLAFIRLKEATDQEVADHLQFQINWITGRRKELQEAGIIVSYGKKKPGKYGLVNTVWHVDYRRLKDYLQL